MASVSTSFKFKSFFGRIPSTEAIEKNQTLLISEYQWFTDFKDSEFLKDFRTLEKNVTSKEFVKKLDDLKNDTFDKTKEYRQLVELKKIQKSGPVKKAIKYIKSGIPAQMDKTSESKEWKNFSEMRVEVESATFRSKKKELETLKKYEESDIKKKFDLYNDLKNKEEIKRFLKITSSKKYKRYIDTIKSSEYNKYLQLLEIVNSDEFKKVKAEKEDTERYKNTGEYKELQRYEELKKSDDIIRYTKLKNSNKFDELRNWELTFVDEFNSRELDKDKWITHYYWGKALLNEGYSLSTDKHFPTDGKNLEIKDSVLRIVSRKEKYNGKVWDPKVGFYPKDFEYTSGLISTGTSFRQKYGRFEAKIKINSKSPVTNAFWMVSDIMLPQIDVIKSSGHNKLSVANHWGPQIKSNIARFSSGKFSDDFFIYSVEWEKGVIRWKLNNVLIREETKGVPDAAMYMVFSSGLSVDADNASLPTSFEIDWVKCYQKKDK